MVAYWHLKWIAKKGYSSNVLFYPHGILTLQNKTKISRCSHPEVFLGQGVLKISSKFTGEHPC